MSVKDDDTPKNEGESDEVTPRDDNAQNDQQNQDASDANNANSVDKPTNDDLFRWMSDNYADLNEALKNIENTGNNPNEYNFMDLFSDFQMPGVPMQGFPGIPDSQSMRNFQAMFNSPEFIAVMNALNSPPQKRGKIDSNLVLQFAKQGMHNIPILSSDTELARSAYSAANLWVDAETQFVPRQTKIQAIKIGRAHV
jgi:hypothetical protein